MATKTITLRMDEDLKADFDIFCEEVGLTTTTAVTMFVKATLRENRIPFEVSADPFYSQANLAALDKSKKELEAGEYVSVDSADFDKLLAQV